jgi:1-acyl-sn-glycerol-3-phosphate acyltransferase
MASEVGTAFTSKKRKLSYGIIASMLEMLARTVLSPKRGARALSPLASRAAVRPCRWSSGFPARCVRFLFYPILLTAIRGIAWLRIRNAEVLNSLDGPVILASNHQSDLDTAVLLAALPRPWCYRMAPTGCDACFAVNQPLVRVLKYLHYVILLLFTNGLTLPRGIGFRVSLRHMAWLVDKKWSILIYPEGEISNSDQLLPFEAGVGMIATRLRLPVVPVRIDGTRRVWNRSSKMIRPGPVLVRFGSPLLLQGNDYRAMTKQVEQAIRALKD